MRNQTKKPRIHRLHLKFLNLNPARTFFFSVAQKLHLLNINRLLVFVQKTLAPETKPVMAGIWPDEKTFLSAVKSFKQKGGFAAKSAIPVIVHRQLFLG